MTARITRPASDRDRGPDLQTKLEPSRTGLVVPTRVDARVPHRHASCESRETVMHAADVHDVIRVQGARENNLSNVSVEIPKRRLTVFPGVSGSGKSSLVFATIAAESQRLLNETYSAFVQGFMPSLACPDVDLLGFFPPSSTSTATSCHWFPKPQKRPKPAVKSRFRVEASPWRALEKALATCGRLRPPGMFGGWCLPRSSKPSVGRC